MVLLVMVRELVYYFLTELDAHASAKFAQKHTKTKEQELLN
jgi:hypothetical protein